jgi:hypothetical protein
LEDPFHGSSNLVYYKPNKCSIQKLIFALPKENPQISVKLLYEERLTNY